MLTPSNPSAPVNSLENEAELLFLACVGKQK